MPNAEHAAEPYGRLPDWVIGIILLVFVVPTAILLGIAVLFLAPQQISRQSPQSKQLQSTVVPQLLAWGKSESNELRLNRLKALQAFDHVCYVWQYMPYDTIEAEIGPVEDFFGAYGGYLPENRTAFIGVRGSSAHVAHIRGDTFLIGRGGMRNCAAVPRAFLVKEKLERPYPTPQVLAVLVEK